MALISTSSQKEDGSARDRRGNDPSSYWLRRYDPSSWLQTMSISGGFGALVMLILFFLWIEIEPDIVGLWLLGPLTGGIVAGYLLRKYQTDHTLVGVASGLLAAFPVLAIVAVNVFASVRTLGQAGLTDSWIEVTRTAGLGLSLTAGLTALSVMLIAFAMAGAAGRVIGSSLAARLSNR